MPRSSSVAALALALTLTLTLAPAAARADDWLVDLPSCAQGSDARTPGLMRILYPRPGLPALVTAGDRLVARVRVPSGLTPPPGIQQDRALRHWSAVLVGDGLSLASGTEQRYVLRVTDVRPDTGSTLVYRATVPIPVWVVAGTYSLRMTAPGGGAIVVAAVRVIEAGRAPRIAQLGPAAAAQDPAAMRALLVQSDVDVWIGTAPVGVPRSPAPIVLALPAPAVVLRVGARSLVLGRCDQAPLTPAAQARVLGGAPLRALDPAALARIERRPGGETRVTVPVGAPADVALTLLVPNDGRATRARGAAAYSFWPASPVGASLSTRTLALRIVAHPGAEVRVTRADAPALRARIEISPNPVAAGLPTRLRGVASRHARFLWRHGEDLSGLGPTVVRAYTNPGSHPVDVLAIADDGVATRATATLNIEARQTHGCSASARAGGRLEAVELLILAILWQIRRVGPRRRE